MDLLKALGKGSLRFCLLAMAGWATVAIWYSNIPELINERAKGRDKSLDFSQMIRVGLPGKELIK